MPDADDFDVEYFRNLLKGNNPKEVRTPPVEPSSPVAKKPTRPSAKPSATKKKTQRKLKGAV